MLKRLLLATALLFAALQPALAVDPAEVLDDPALEARARDISKGLRCVVCQNQSIDDSDAPLARDLRLLVRERLQAGDSDEDTMEFIVDRYGDFVLLRPPFKTSTLILWIGPALILIAGILGVVIWHRRRPATAVSTSTAPLSVEEQAKLDRVLAKDSDR